MDRDVEKDVSPFKLYGKGATLRHQPNSKPIKAPGVVGDDDDGMPELASSADEGVLDPDDGMPELVSSDDEATGDVQCWTPTMVCQNLSAVTTKPRVMCSYLSQ